MNPFMKASEAPGLSSSRLPFDQQVLLQAQMEVRPGEYYMIKKHGGEDWPVVICDEEIVQKFFKSKQRPAGARRSDGTWAKEFAGNKCYPAVIPGTLKLCWPESKALEMLDPKLGKVIGESSTNPSLKQAWDEAINCDHENKTISYWKEKLDSREKARLRKVNDRDGVSGENQGGSRKRKGTPTFKLPPGYVREEADDDEGDLFLPLPDDASGPKIKKEWSDSASSAEIDALYGDLEPSYTRPTESDKRNKLNAAGRFSVLPQASTRCGDRSTMTPSHSQGPRSVASINDDKIMIYVGNPHQKFRARRNGLEASPLLSKLATYHPGNGWYLMSPLLSSLDADDFFPVGQYLERGEYNPNILDEGTDWVRLEDGLTDQQRGQEVIRCGKIYCLAQTLELPGLQALAIRKLKALAKHEPYHPFAILSVTEAVFERGEDDLRNYLIHYIAENYWNIVLAEANKSAEVFKADEELSRGVYRQLSGVARLRCFSTKVEEEQEVKAENQADLAKEVNPGSVTPTSSSTTLGNEQGKETSSSGLEGIADLGLGRKAESSMESKSMDGMIQVAPLELVLTEEERVWLKEDEELLNGLQKT